MYVACNYTIYFGNRGVVHLEVNVLARHGILFFINEKIPNAREANGGYAETSFLKLRFTHLHERSGVILNVTNA